ncbi:fibronectin type III domain-containing protein [Hymenobacter sp. BT664]|uniref:Fibronectin type III domain-containing protein n=1 Tax=Hymenobacter montanus TaxID=2771359 RepID=A0A927GIA4_9BACT|nr:fibronectin type III domain-containing protein [Hymenobacter montanus]MBD2766914.1 fibronectin type III domain-containing protein [Hymenobacter montanus]
MQVFTSLWRRWLLPALLVIGGAAVCPAQAQVNGYSFTASAGTFTPLANSATNVPVLLADDATSGSTLLPLGFSFVFGGVAYTGVKASSNGFLSFNANASYNVGNQLSTNAAATEKPLLAPLWDDLAGSAAGARASYQTSGTAPNRVFTFEWLNWKWSYQATGPVISFQVKLYEGTNRIEYIYRPESMAPATGPSFGASIGLAGPVPAMNPSAFLSLNNSSAAPVTSSTTETRTITTAPAAGQMYAFEPGTSAGCSAPFDLGAAPVTGTTATLTFQGPAIATGYTVTYQAAGGPLQTLSPAPTASPVTLSGLTPNTTYTATVAAACGGGLTSPPTTVTFNTTAGYCATNLGGTCGPDNITAINLSGTTLNASGLTCTSSGAPAQAYTSYPASGSTTATVQRGSTYQLIVTTGANDIISAWLDADHSLSFEPGEWVQVAVSSGVNLPSTVNITVPATAALGQTVLRVRSRRTPNTNGPSDACTNFGLGETKDFILTITEPSACPLPTNLSASNATQNGATLSFALGGGGGTATLIYGPAGFDPATSGTSVVGATSPLTLTTLQPSTAYQFYVRQNCGGAAGTSPLAGPINFATTPTNDDPCAAIVLPLNSTCVPLNTTNLGATITTSPSVSASACTGVNFTPRDVWFSFTTAATGPGSTAVRISVTGSSASIVQALRGTSCTGPFVNVRCVGGQSNVAAPALDLTSLTASTTYWVRVHTFQFNDLLGAFSICATASTVSAARAQAEADGLLVSPNPSASGEFTLHRSSAQAGEASLFNALGQCVLRQSLRPAAEQTVDARSLAPGLYTLRVAAGGQVLTRRVVLE